MCFSRLRKTKEKVPKYKYGWKVFDVDYDSKELRFEFYGGNVVTNKWLVSKSEEKRLYVGCNKYYRNGFHCFVTKRGAQAWASPNQYVVRVEVKNVRSCGYQQVSMTLYKEFAVFTCGKIRVPKESTYE